MCYRRPLALSLLLFVLAFMMLAFPLRGHGASFWPPSPDRTAPSVPTGVTATPISSSQITLTWNKSTDTGGSGLLGYRIYRGATIVGTGSANFFTDKGLTADTAFSYSIQAVDRAYNSSAKSTPAVGVTFSESEPPPITGKVGHVGCSMTMGAIDGVQELGSNLSWSMDPVYGGGGFTEWASNLTNTNKFWAEFDKALLAEPVTRVWFELCSLSSKIPSQTIDNARKVVGEIKRRVPGATVYVSAQPDYSPSDHECSIAGTDQPVEMQELVELLVANGDAERGPELAPLVYPDHVVSDGCHGNSLGNQIQGQTFIDFFLNEQGPPPPAPETIEAAGAYVVDDGDTVNYEKALDAGFTGGVVRVDWKSQELTDDKFDFTGVCSKISKVHKKGKLVTLDAFANAPTHVQAAEHWTHPLKRWGSQPAPWDKNAQAEFKEWLAALANSSCDGYSLKNHPAIRNINASILGTGDIRDAPPYNITAMTEAVVFSIGAYREAFGLGGHNFFSGLFPINKNGADASSIWAAVQKAYPGHGAFQETWTGAGPSGALAEVLEPKADPRKFPILLQACGYWSNQAKIRCTFAVNDSLQLGLDNVALKMKVRYVEIYPADAVNSKYAAAVKQAIGLASADKSKKH